MRLSENTVCFEQRTAVDRNQWIRQRGCPLGLRKLVTKLRCGPVIAAQAHSKSGVGFGVEHRHDEM